MAGELEGVAELTKKFQELGAAATGAALRSAARAAMKPAADRAKALIPVGTVAHRTFKGRLVAPGFARRSIRVVTKLSRDKQKVTALLGVRREAFYAVQFVELGTSKTPAEPWLRTAFESQKDPALRAIGDNMRKRIERIANQRAARASAK